LSAAIATLDTQGARGLLRLRAVPLLSTSTAFARCGKLSSGMEKRSHLGMSGHYAAMSEFLYRGYNVAVPAVDIGDDVYIVEDGEGTMWRLQVKTSDQPADISGTYSLSRRQLREVKANELFFMFLARRRDRWRFILIGRDKLAEIRTTFEFADRPGRPGPKPKGDADARTDVLTLKIDWNENDAAGWGASFAAYLDQWPDTFPVSTSGPGAVTTADPSPDL
jgi:hypothetical protein